jgi:hypothetical protein
MSALAAKPQASHKAGTLPQLWLRRLSAKLACAIHSRNLLKLLGVALRLTPDGVSKGGIKKEQ